MNQRHRDLNRNELEKLVASAKPWLEKHGNKLIYATCAAMLAFALYYYVTQSSTVERSAGWSAFISANELEDYANIASTYKGRPPGQWAMLSHAEALLDQGIRLAILNPMPEDATSDASEELENPNFSDIQTAKEKFEELLAVKDLDPALEERALFGLARSLESLAGEDTSKAVEAYEALLEKFPDSIYKPIAEKQIAALKADEGQEFYAWFNARQPTPTPTPGSTRGGLPPGHPDVNPEDLIRLPEIPDMLKLPESSAPAFPEGLGEPGGESSIPPTPPKPTDPGAENSPPESTAPPLPENP